jgi:hypothetical protein
MTPKDILYNTILSLVVWTLVLLFAKFLIQPLMR